MKGYFRGKTLRDGEWVDGSYVYAHKYFGTGDAAHFIYDIYGEHRIMVDPDTLSECSGLSQWNNLSKMIFEGDLLKIISWVKGANGNAEEREDIALVERDKKTGGYRLKVYNNGKYKRISKFSENHLLAYKAEVIGNKWDNADLLEGKNG